MKALLTLAIVGYIWAMAPEEPRWFQPLATAALLVVIGWIWFVL